MKFLNNGARVAKKTAQLVAVLMVLALVSAPRLFSQAAVGTILGAVNDSTGAAIVGAKVTITDTARGTTRVLMTDQTGQYTAPSLLVGTYSVRAEAQGFQTIERTNVLLEVAQSVRVDLALTPGATTQTVTVTEEAPAINSTDAVLGGTVTNESVANLPLVTRNFLDLLQLRPGVVSVPGTPSTTTSNGRREGSDVLLVEGVTQFDLATANVLINGAQKGNAVDQLPLDSVQEFSSQQNPQAEYGWRDGSAVNLAVKSGTNSIHGSAYAFGRDAAATDAALFNVLPPETKNNLTVEQPGFTLGGRVIKDKLFWFVSAEFIRQSSFATNSSPAPTDVSLVGASSTGTGCGSVQYKTTTPGNCAGSMVDACNDVLAQGQTINPLSAQIAGLLPGNCVPQPATATFENLFPSTNTGSIFPDPVTNISSNNGLAKVDYSPDEKNHFDGFVYISRGTTSAGGVYEPDWGTVGLGHTEEYAGAWTYTPNSRWVNDLRGGAAPNLGSSLPGDSTRTPGNAYPGGYSINTGVAAPQLGLVCITISGAISRTGFGDCGRIGARGPQYQLDFTDKVSYLHGNHAFKFGYEEVFVHFDDASTANQPGTIAFRNLENFLTGSVNTASVLLGNNTDQFRERWHAAFFQDTWRIAPRITLTPGIRWEYIGSPHSADNHLGIFNPAVPGGVEQVGPGLPQSTLIYPEKFNFNPRMGFAWDIRGNGRTVLRAEGAKLSSFPTLLAVTGNAVPYGATLCNGPAIPGPGGIGTSCAPANIVVNHYGQPVQGFFATNLSLAGSSQVNWTTTCTNPAQTATCNGPTIFPVSSGFTSTSGPTCSTGKGACSMETVDPNFKVPKSVQWNVDLQRALTNTLTLDVAYVGVHGYDETHNIDLNEAPVGAGWDTTAIGNCLASYSIATFTSNCAVDKNAESNARPYNTQFPYYSFIAQTTSGFISNYNGLQVTLDARNFHGLSFLTAYTYGYALDDWTKNSQATSVLADPNNPQYQYGHSDLDLRHRLRFSPTYKIPGIKSPGQLLEGWQVSGIWALQSGFAWAPNDSGTDDWGGNNEIANSATPNNTGIWQSWNYTGPHSAFNGNGDVPIQCYGRASGCTLFANAGGAQGSAWMACSAAAQAPYATAQLQALTLAALTSGSGACYMQKGGILTPPAYGTLGNATRGMFVGPKYQNVDIALEKVWKFKERYSAQLRIECYNVFNQASIAPFSDGSSDPSGGGGVVSGGGTFGFATSGVIGDGGSSNRQFQFGLKLMF